MPEDSAGPASSSAAPQEVDTIEVQNTSFQRGVSGRLGQQQDNIRVQVTRTSLTQPPDVSDTGTNGSGLVDETAIASLLEGFPVAEVEALEDEPIATEHQINPKSTRKRPELRAAVSWRCNGPEASCTSSNSRLHCRIACAAGYPHARTFSMNFLLSKVLKSLWKIVPRCAQCVMCTRRQSGVRTALPNWLDVLTASCCTTQITCYTG